LAIQFMVLLLKALSRLPLRILYGVSTVLFVLAYHIVRYRRKVVTVNLQKAFPTKSKEELASIRKEFYRRFADFSMEVLKGFTISKEEIVTRVTFINKDIFKEYAEKGESLVVLTSHQFNWEWVLISGCAQLALPVDAVYQKLGSPSMERLMYEARARFGGRPINRRHVIRELIRTKERVRAIAMVADQAPGRTAPTYWTTFLHQETGFSPGAEQVPHLLNCDTFFLKPIRTKRGYYSVELVLLGKAPYIKGSYELLDRYVQATEKLIQEDPAGWLWTHKRWKRKRPRE
jgi:Kdo2-lipid IVA lauroyltransferase/acyltransferase